MLHTLAANLFLKNRMLCTGLLYQIQLDAGMWRYHANRMDARRSQFDLGRVDEYCVHLAEGSNVVILEQEICSVELGVCPMQLFYHFLITSWKSDDFTLRYGDISIFKMGAVRHLGIVLPPYETTHEVPVKFHVNLIHRSEDRCLNFSHIWLEMPIQFSKTGVLGDFGPLTVIIHHRDPHKAHPCVNPRLLSYQL